MTESEEMERQAIEFVKEYKVWLSLSPSMKAFFKRLAEFLGWQNLRETLK